MTSKICLFVTLLLLYKTTSQDTNCTDCVNIIREVRKNIQSPEEIIVSVCPDEECAVSFLTRLDTIISSINGGQNDMQVCTATGHCKSVSEDNSKIQAKLKCSVCVATLTTLWEHLSMDATSQQVTTLLNASCTKFPTCEEFCNSLQLKGSVARIIEALTGGKTPQNTCTNLNLCTSTPDKNNDRVIEDVHEEDHISSSTLRCSICQGIVNVAKNKIVSTNISQPYDIFDTLCNQIPPALKAICTDLRPFGTIIESSITSGTESSQICQSTGFCSDSDILLSKSAAQTFRSGSGSGAPVTCQSCQWAISAIEAYLSQETTEQELANVLKELCTIMPDTYAKICQSFISVYLSEAVVFVLDNLTPPFVCGKLLVC